MGYQHLLDTAILQVEPDRAECTEDNTFYPLEVLLQTEHIEQPVDGMQRLFYLLNKKDDVLFSREMVFGPGNRSIT